jgi:hypothetical protein
MTILDDAAVATSIIGNAISQTNELYLSHLRDFFTLSIVVQFSTPIKGSIIIIIIIISTLLLLLLLLL